MTAACELGQDFKGGIVQKIEKPELWLARGFVALGLVTVTVMIVRTLPSPLPAPLIEKLGSDIQYASWAQAMFGAGAIWAAVWLAGSQDRRRKAEELGAAQLIAARVSGELRNLIYHSQHLSAVLAFYDDVEYHLIQGEIFPIEQLALAVDNAPPTETLLQLQAIEGGAANRIAYAVSELNVLVREIRDTQGGDYWEGLAPSRREELVLSWYKVADRAFDMLRVAYDACATAAQAGAPPLSFEERYGAPDPVDEE